ncbi:Glutathione S-transferase T1 [Capsicum chinense]|nr:Glutathione S-transferase T1 [Capsicum chinense]
MIHNWSLGVTGKVAEVTGSSLGNSFWQKCKSRCTQTDPNTTVINPWCSEINPMKQVPAMMHEGFKLFESHAILRYLTYAFPRVADHWFRVFVFCCLTLSTVLSKVSNCFIQKSRSRLRVGLASLLTYAAVQPRADNITSGLGHYRGLSGLDGSDARRDQGLGSGRDKNGSGRGRSRQDIRSISMSATWKWIDETRNATEPHFHEVHKILFRFKKKLIKLRSAESNSQRRRHP